MKEDYYIPVSNDLNPLTAKFFFKKTDFCLHELTLKRDCWSSTKPNGKVLYTIL